MPAEQSLPRTGGELRFDTFKRARVSDPSRSVDVDRLLDSIDIPGPWVEELGDGSDLEDSSDSSKTIGEICTLDDSTDTLEDDQPDIRDVLYQHPYLREPTESPDLIALAVTQAVEDEQGGNGGFTQAMTNLLLRNPTDYNEPCSYKEAMANHYYKMDWQLGIQDEIDSLLENNTWTLVTPPNRANILNRK